MKKNSIHGPCQINRIQNDNNRPKEENDTAPFLFLSNASHSAVGKKYSFLFFLSFLFKISCKAKHSEKPLRKDFIEVLCLIFNQHGWYW